MRKIFYILSTICMFCSLSIWASDCQFESKPIILESGESHLMQYWDFSNSSIIDLATLPNSSRFIFYRNLVQSKINIDPIELLLRYSKAGVSVNDTYNLNVVLSNPLKYIQPIKCLEALLLNNQFERNTTMPINPTEFLAFYLKNNENQLRVYYLTDDISGVRKVSPLLSHIETDVKNGWTLIGNLHNHSFFLENINQDETHHPQGVLIPSSNDIQVLRATRDEFKMQNASITNGFNTIFISAEELDKFHDPKGL
jgi:hypothetical protein